MDCDGCLERLYAYLDKELDQDELATVRAHLDDCGPCDDSFIFERRFLDAIRDCCTSDVAPKDVRERIVLRVRSAS